MSLQSLLSDLRSILPAAEQKISGFSRDRDSTPQADFVAPNLDLLDEALDRLPNASDRGEWIKLCAAMRGAYGADLERGRVAFLKFSERWTGSRSTDSDESLVEEADREWESFEGKTVGLGADFLFSKVAAAERLLGAKPRNYRAEAFFEPLEEDASLDAETALFANCEPRKGAAKVNKANTGLRLVVGGVSVEAEPTVEDRVVAAITKLTEEAVAAGDEPRLGFALGHIMTAMSDPTITREAVKAVLPKQMSDRIWARHNGWSLPGPEADASEPIDLRAGGYTLRKAGIVVPPFPVKAEAVVPETFEIVEGMEFLDEDGNTILAKKYDPGAARAAKAAEAEALNAAFTAFLGTHPSEEPEPTEPKPEVKPKEFPPTLWTYKDPTTLPMIQFAYGDHYIRSVLSVTVAAGGVGKSSLGLVEAVCMASGLDLLGQPLPEGRVKVWVWNGEDDQNLLNKRIAAILIHYGIRREQIEGWLYVDSGVDLPLCLVSGGRGQAKRDDALLKSITKSIKARGIGVVIMDPLISLHAVDENDNGGIGVLARALSKIASDCNCAIDVVHHIRKPKAGQTEIEVDDGRGGKSLTDKVRSARVLNQMTETEAGKAGVQRARRFFRVSNGKANLIPPPPDKSDWYELASVRLGNGGARVAPGAPGAAAPDFFHVDGDSIGVVTQWRWPDATEGVTDEDLVRVQAKIASGEWRDSVQSPEGWVGYAVAEAMGLDRPVAKSASRTKVLALVAGWVKSGALQIVSRPDSKRMPRNFVVVGKPAGK